MILGLDGLRAIAFLMIFGFHTGTVDFGWMGVQIFFVFSGFLITDILLRMKEKLPASEYFKKFYIRRFFRIFPLYYFYLFLIFVAATWLLSVSYKPRVMRAVVDQIWYAILYVYNFYSASYTFNPSRMLDHLWSLSVEEQFYIIWPLLILLVNEKHLKKLFVAGIIAGPVFRLIIFIIYQIGDVDSFRTYVWFPIYTLPFSHIDAFAFGAYISRFSIPNARKQLLYLSFAVPLIGFATQFIANGYFEPFLTLGYQVTLPDAYQYIWAYTLLNYWFVVIIYCVAREKMFVQFLDWPPLQYLGKISYGLYIYHFPLIWIAGLIRDHSFPDAAARPVILVGAFVGTVAVASLSYYMLERPFLKLKDRFASYLN